MKTDQVISVYIIRGNIIMIINNQNNNQGVFLELLVAAKKLELTEAPCHHQSKTWN